MASVSPLSSQPLHQGPSGNSGLSVGHNSSLHDSEPSIVVTVTLATPLASGSSIHSSSSLSISPLSAPGNPVVPPLNAGEAHAYTRSGILRKPEQAPTSRLVITPWTGRQKAIVSIMVFLAVAAIIGGVWQVWEGYRQGASIGVGFATIFGLVGLGLYCWYKGHKKSLYAIGLILLIGLVLYGVAQGGHLGTRSNFNPHGLPALGGGLIAFGAILAHLSWTKKRGFDKEHCHITPLNIVGDQESPPSSPTHGGANNEPTPTRPIIFEEDVARPRPLPQYGPGGPKDPQSSSSPPPICPIIPPVPSFTVHQLTGNECACPPMTPVLTTTVAKN